MELLLFIPVLAAIGVLALVVRRRSKHREMVLREQLRPQFADWPSRTSQRSAWTSLAWTPRSAATLDAGAIADYQRALDAYEAAKIASEALMGPDDIQGLAETIEDGRYAIACVRARVSQRPLPARRPPCFFDPRHGISVTDVPYTPADGSERQVPACALDTQRIRASAEPDIRKVPVGTSRVPYWDGGPAYAPYAAGYFGVDALTWLFLEASPSMISKEAATRRATLPRATPAARKALETTAASSTAPTSDSRHVAPTATGPELSSHRQSHDRPVRAEANSFVRPRPVPHRGHVVTLARRYSERGAVDHSNLTDDLRAWTASALADGAAGVMAARDSDVTAAGACATAWPHERVRGARHVRRGGSRRRKSDGGSSRGSRDRQVSPARVRSGQERGVLGPQGSRDRVGDGAPLRRGSSALPAAPRRFEALAATPARGPRDGVRAQSRRAARSLLRGSGPARSALCTGRRAPSRVPRRRRPVAGSGFGPSVVIRRATPPRRVRRHRPGRARLRRPERVRRTARGAPRRIVGGRRGRAGRVSDHRAARQVGEAADHRRGKRKPARPSRLPRAQTSAALAGGYSVATRLPLPSRIEASYRGRIRLLPVDTQHVLLLASADPVGDPVLFWRAASLLGIPVEAAAAAEAADLLEIDGRVGFRHPLLRSAIYRAATPAERRAAHRALAAATDPEIDPDRRAWHRAQAVLGPDEDVAAELERRAGRAQDRGGFAAAAAFLQRAVVLTQEPARRADRALAAAQASLQAGEFDAALRLVGTAEAWPLDDLGSARVNRLRAEVAFALDRDDSAATSGRSQSRDP